MGRIGFKWYYCFYSICSIGYFTIKYCEKLFTFEKSIDILKIASESYNNGIEEMKILSKTFKR